MAEDRQKIKLIKLYELLRKETDADHPASLVELEDMASQFGDRMRILSPDTVVNSTVDTSLIFANRTDRSIYFEGKQDGHNKNSKGYARHCRSTGA